MQNFLWNKWKTGFTTSLLQVTFGDSLIACLQASQSETECILYKTIDSYASFENLEFQPRIQTLLF